MSRCGVRTCCCRWWWSLFAGQILNSLFAKSSRLSSRRPLKNRKIWIVYSPSLADYPVVGRCRVETLVVPCVLADTRVLVVGAWLTRFRGGVPHSLLTWYPHYFYMCVGVVFVHCHVYPTSKQNDMCGCRLSILGMCGACA